jgi:hypothetical protein
MANLVDTISRDWWRISVSNICNWKKKKIQNIFSSVIGCFFFQGDLIFLFITSISLHNLRIVSGFFLLSNDDSFNKFGLLKKYFGFFFSFSCKYWTLIFVTNLARWYCKKIYIDLKSKHKQIQSHGFYTKGRLSINLKFKMNNMELEIVSEFIYLGTMYQRTGSFKKHKINLVEKVEVLKISNSLQKF